MPRGIDPDSINFVIVDLARLLRAEFERGVMTAGLGVTPAEARVLAHLARCGAVRQHLLAERLGVTQMSLTAFIDRLEQMRLVERRGDPTDRRAKQVHLTPAADPVLAGIGAIALHSRAIARGSIPDADWDLFKAVALAARDNLVAARELREAKVLP